MKQRRIHWLSFPIVALLTSVPFARSAAPKGAMVEPKAEQARVNVTGQVSPDVTEIVADPLRLKQILINLTNNAIKFTKNGDVVVSAELVKKYTDTIDLRLTCNVSGSVFTTKHIELNVERIK